MLEGQRGSPRPRPPYPAQEGLWGSPTLINNVETFCNIPLIVQGGAAEYRKIGTQRSPGPKLFCVSGQIEKPGLYEVPFGVTLRHLLFELAGGLKQGRKLQAVLMGGAAGVARVGSAAVESMARQPEVAGAINTAMIITAAMIEGATLFAVVVTLLAVLG